MIRHDARLSHYSTCDHLYMYSSCLIHYLDMFTYIQDNDIECDMRGFTREKENDQSAVACL